MTAYRNFVEDFPRRCRDILKVAGKPALSRGREVTLNLVIASAGLLVPYERVKPDGRWAPILQETAPHLLTRPESWSCSLLSLSGHRVCGQRPIRFGMAEN